MISKQRNNNNTIEARKIRERTRAFENSQRSIDAKSCTFRPAIDKRSKLLADKKKRDDFRMG